jgi:hypothetical protein
LVACYTVNFTFTIYSRIKLGGVVVPSIFNFRNGSVEVNNVT